jgi:S1-C subfamily serine protease
MLRRRRLEPQQSGEILMPFHRIVAPAGLALWLALSVAAAAAAAQEKEEKEKSTERSERVRSLVTATLGDSCHVHVFSQHRGRLGIYLEPSPNPETDSIGALVQGVAEDSPADEAGIEKGDIITRFNAERLAAAARDESRATPGRRLLDLARELEPGDSVRLEYRRGRDVRTVTLVAESAPAFSFRYGPEGLRDLGTDFHIPRMDRLHQEMERLRDLPRRLEVGFPGLAAFGLELVSLNPDLGAYFGTTEGILVVDVPEGSTLGLKAGDVLLSIEGREPSSPGHALRILRSYEPGEEITFEILREKKKTTVKGKASERASMRRHAPAPPEPPEAP